ncbi:MarR family transcriptional regulator, partial [Streptomyces sp. NRRL F-6602]
FMDHLSPEALAELSRALGPVAEHLRQRPARG